MAEDVEARLQGHARAFEGLMSLIPAKEYYGKDESITSTQWNRKKQTREERQAAKRAKLDPASHQTAKDVMDENTRKRKRELEGIDSSDVEIDVEKEKPLEGMKQPSKSKKQKIANDSNNEENTNKVADNLEAHDAKAKARADKRKQRLDKKKAKLEKRQQKQDAKKLLQKESGNTSQGSGEGGEGEEEENGIAHEDEDDRIRDLDVSGLVDSHQSTATPSSANSNVSTASVASEVSSSSSLVPRTTGEEPKKNRKEHKPYTIDPEKHEAFRVRLNAKLEAMRAARKADGPDGRPAKNRAELIEARRKKQNERKAAKKANRQLGKEDQERLDAEEQLARIRGGSGSPSIFSRSTPDSEHNFSFGRVAWMDGQQLTNNLFGFLDSGKKKGKQDPKTALLAAEHKRARLNGFDEAKRKDIEEKDLWLAAKKRAQGEKVHDDATLLRKQLKRQERAKAKSKQEWKDRLTGVAQSKEAKQKKREENLKKRREDKGSKGNGTGNKVSKPAKKKQLRRPGFEGTFRAR